MCVKKLCILVSGFIFYLQFSYADTTTIVLQNGLNNYNGFEDTYNFTESPDSNYHNDPLLLIWNCIA